MGEKKKDGIYFIPVAIKNGELYKLTDLVPCEDVSIALSKSVVDAFASFFAVKSEGVEDGTSR